MTNPECEHQPDGDNLAEECALQVTVTAAADHACFPFRAGEHAEVRFLSSGRTARSARGPRGASEGTGHGPARETEFMYWLSFPSPDGP